MPGQSILLAVSVLVSITALFTLACFVLAVPPWDNSPNPPRGIVSYYFSGFWHWVALTIGVGITAVGAYFLARWSWRWFLASASR